MMRFNFRKIAATAASIAMMGSTIGLAAAANYPNPFVTGGVADVAFVYGSAGASSDLVATIDISNSLQSFITGDSDGTTEITGESYALWTSSTKIYLNDSINKARTVVSESNLPTVLADGKIQGDVTATYDQRIDISSTVGTNNRLVFGKHPTSDDDPTVAFDLGTTKGTHIYNLTITFNKAVNFTHTDTEGESLTLFGKEWVVGAETDNSNLILLQSASKINLDSESSPSEQVTLEGGTYTVELVSASDTSATIRLTDSTGATDTKTINEDASKSLLDLEVAVTDADETNFKLSATVTVGSDKIKLTENTAIKVGSDETTLDGTNVRFGDDGTQRLFANLTKLIFQASAEDSDVDALLEGGDFIDPFFGSLKMTFPTLSIPEDSTTDREDIIVKNSGSDKMTVTFQTWDGDEPKTFNWLYNKTSALRADGFTAAGHSALADSNGNVINVFERMQINKSEFVVAGNEDTGGVWELTTLSNTSDSTDDTIEFKNKFTGDIQKATISAEGSGSVVLGTHTFTVDYAIDKDADDSAHNARLRYQDGSRTTANNAVLYPTVETSKGASLAFYEPVQINFSNWDASAVHTNISKINIPDGDGYTAVTVTRNPTTIADTTNFTIQFGSGTVIDLNNTLDSEEGTIGQLTYNISKNTGGDALMTVYLDDVGGSRITTPAIVIFEEKDDSSGQTYEALIVKVEGAGTTAASLGVADVETTWSLDTQFDEIQLESDSDLYRSANFWGTIITTDQSDTDSYTTTISYPDEQMYAELYFAEAEATASSGGGGGTLGSVTVMDSEVSSVSSKNLVVVGGSCINTVAASLLGSDSPMCGSAWTGATGAGAGQYLVQTFDGLSSGKVATLIAGTEASDTTNAATYFRTQSPMTNVGDKYLGTTSTSAELQTEAS